MAGFLCWAAHFRSIGPRAACALQPTLTLDRHMKPKNEPGIPAWRGDALRLRRIAAGWKTQDLADRLGVSKTTIIRWETNENAPGSEHVRQLAEALDVEVAAFAKAPRIV